MARDFSSHLFVFQAATPLFRTPWRFASKQSWRAALFLHSCSIWHGSCASWCWVLDSSRATFKMRKMRNTGGVFGFAVLSLPFWTLASSDLPEVLPAGYSAICRQERVLRVWCFPSSFFNFVIIWPGEEYWGTQKLAHSCMSLGWSQQKISHGLCSVP